MMRGVVVYEHSIPLDFYCVRGHGDTDCIWVADNSFVEVSNETKCVVPEPWWCEADRERRQ